MPTLCLVSTNTPSQICSHVASTLSSTSLLRPNPLCTFFISIRSFHLFCPLPGPISRTRLGKMNTVCIHSFSLESKFPLAYTLTTWAHCRLTVRLVNAVFSTLRCPQKVILPRCRSPRHIQLDGHTAHLPDAAGINPVSIRGAFAASDGSAM